MNRLQTRGIILSRTDYGEADRILTVLTPDHGKLRLMARGVRKPKSKLAGGIELFSTSDMTFIRGRGEIGTLISTRLIKHYERIVHDITRVQLGYDLIKLLNKATEDEPETDYFQILEETFQSLNDVSVSPVLIRDWFSAQLLRLAGHSPNLETDTAGQQLRAANSYNFDPEAMAFAPTARGKFKADHIKAMRLLFSAHTPRDLNKVQQLDEITVVLSPLIRTMLTSYIRV